MNLYWQMRALSLIVGLFISIGGACQIFGGYTNNFFEWGLALAEFLFGTALIYTAISPNDTSANQDTYIHPDKILYVNVPSKYATENEWIEYHAQLGRVAEHNYRLTYREKDLDELVYLWKSYSDSTFNEMIRDVSDEVVQATKRRIQKTGAKKYQHEEREFYEYY